MDSDIALGNLIHERIFGAREKKREAEAERLKNEASEATTLRKLMSLYDPERKDHFTTMDLPNLRGEVMAFTGKQRQMKEAKDAMTAQALQELLGEFNQPAQPTEIESPSAPGLFPNLRTSTTRPLNANNLRAALPRHAAAAAHPNLPDLLRILQQGDLQDEEGGLPQILPGPFPNTRIVTDARGRSTPQVVRESDSSRFTVEPIMDRFGRPAGYGVKAQFGSEEEAKAWADKQNKGGASVPASQYKTADDVKAAFKDKKLSRDDALNILKTQFGYQ